MQEHAPKKAGITDLRGAGIGTTVPVTGSMQPSSPMNTARTTESAADQQQQQQRRSEAKESEQNLELDPEFFDVIAQSKMGVVSASPLSDDGRHTGEPSSNVVSPNDQSIATNGGHYISMENRITDESALPPDTSKWRIPDDVDDNRPVRRRVKSAQKTTYQF